MSLKSPDYDSRSTPQLLRDAEATIDALDAEIARLRADLAALRAQRCENCAEYDPGFCNLRCHQADFDMWCQKWRQREEGK